MEVRALVSALAPKVLSCVEPLDTMTIGNALYGLRGFTSSNEAATIFQFLQDNISQSGLGSSQLKSVSLLDLMSLDRHLALSNFKNSLATHILQAIQTHTCFLHTKDFSTSFNSRH